MVRRRSDGFPLQSFSLVALICHETECCRLPHQSVTDAGWRWASSYLDRCTTHRGAEVAAGDRALTVLCTVVGVGLGRCLCRSMGRFERTCGCWKRGCIAHCRDVSCVLLLLLLLLLLFTSGFGLRFIPPMPSKQPLLEYVQPRDSESRRFVSP